MKCTSLIDAITFSKCIQIVVDFDHFHSLKFAHLIHLTEWEKQFNACNEIHKMNSDTCFVIVNSVSIAFPAFRPTFLLLLFLIIICGD